MATIGGIKSILHNKGVIKITNQYFMKILEDTYCIDGKNNRILKVLKGKQQCFPILIFILLLSIVTTNLMKAQTVDSTIQKLLNTNLIDKSQLEFFSNYIKKAETKSNSSYINALFLAEFEKLNGHPYNESYMLYSFSRTEIEETERVKINQDLTNYLFKLKSCGFATEKQFNNQKNKISRNAYISILDLLPNLINQIAYDEWLSPNNIVEFAEQLFANKVITEKSFETLKNDAVAQHIQSPYELINYCKNAVCIDLAKCSNNPNIYLEQIHKQVSEILPELQFTNFTFSIEANSMRLLNRDSSYNVVVSINVNGKNYKQKSFIALKDIGKEGNYLGKIDSQEFYQIFNKILADNQSPIRLHQMKNNFQYEQRPTYQYVRIIALEENQLNMFRYTNSYIDLSYENFKNMPTTALIDSSIQLYQQIGLLNHLSKVQIKNAIEKLREKEIKNLNDVLRCLPNIVYSFDTELSNIDNPYAELIKAYAKITHNEFNPTNISDNFDIEKRKKVTLKFTFNGKDYKKFFIIDNDWIDSSFFDFMNNLAANNKLKGKFYDLYTGGQVASVIYLTIGQYNFLKANKLATFADEWQIGLE